MNILAFSFDEEDWTLDVDEIESEIESRLEFNEPIGDIYIGYAVFQEHKHFLNIKQLIENMQDNAYNDYSDGYLEDLTTEKLKELENIVLTWLNENASGPNFYNVHKIKPFSVQEFRKIVENYND